MKNSTNEQKAEFEFLFIMDYWKYFKPWTFLGLAIVGFVGNSLSVIVFVQRKNWLTSGIDYFFWLAICDGINVMLFFLIRGADPPIQLPDYIFAGSTLACKIILPLWCVLCTISSYIICLLYTSPSPRD